MSDFIPCTLKTLPEDQLVEAARYATAINPANAPPHDAVTLIRDLLLAVIPEDDLPYKTTTVQPEFLAVMTNKYWGAGGVDLTVGFLEETSEELRNKILLHMNAWREGGANVKFRWTQTDPVVRISFDRSGYWSYLGTDILRIPRRQPTMNLQGFTVNTSEREFRRVVRHECGHSLGFCHEHSRREIVARLDVAKTIEYFYRTQGWSAQDVRNQVLTPIEESRLIGTEHADEISIMAYQLPGSITIDGQPIVGGSDINKQDFEFAAKIYPLTVVPPQPPPKPPGGSSMLAKILALIAALRAKDWLTAIKILIELIDDMQKGRIGDAEAADCEKSLTTLKP